MKEKTQFRCDFLAWRSIKAVVRWSGFPVTLQLVALAAVVLLATNGWGIGLTQSDSELKLLRKTNLTTLTVWGLWWPGMIAIALGLGRAWCTVCPAELVSRLGHKVGRSAGWARLRLGRWLRAGWLVVLAYLALQLLVAGVSIHRVPHYTSLMLITMFGAALVVGLLFRRPRAFCDGFCPARALLSVYGRYTPVQLDVRRPEVCDRCETRDCVAQQNRFKFDRRSCPSLLRPFKRQQSDGCVLCLQCAKVCPHENVGLGVVEPAAGSRRHRLLEPFEAVFVMIAIGFVAHEVVGVVKPLDKYFHRAPELLNSLAPSLSFGWFEALWFLLLFPAILWLSVVALGYLLGYRGGWWPLLQSAATGAAPVVAVAHLAKAVSKVSQWGGFLPLSVRDPQGMYTFGQITDKTLAQPAPPALAGPIIGWVMLIALLAVGWHSWCRLREADPENSPAACAGFAVATSFFCLVLCTWPWY